MKKIYDTENIYFIIGRNAKRLYDELPDDKFKDSKLKKIEAFSEDIGLSTSFLYHLFSGKQSTQQPSFMTLLTLCNYFGITMDELLDDSKIKDTK